MKRVWRDFTFVFKLAETFLQNLVKDVNRHPIVRLFLTGQLIKSFRECSLFMRLFIEFVFCGFYLFLIVRFAALIFSPICWLKSKSFALCVFEGVRERESNSQEHNWAVCETIGCVLPGTLRLFLLVAPAVVSLRCSNHLPTRASERMLPEMALN